MQSFKYIVYLIYSVLLLITFTLVLKGPLHNYRLDQTEFVANHIHLKGN